MKVSTVERVYRTLCGKPATAAQLATKLKLNKQAVYRALRILAEEGTVKPIDTRPSKRKGPKETIYAY